MMVVFGAQVESAMLHWMKVDPVLSPLSWVARLASRGARYLLAFLATVAVA